ncbi:MAG: cytochrome ubiquinol oxidase subunit I [Sphingopyxis sp.]|uniref:cytochrome ubiquinol oxidase subunit I n=1 Tax=Sphingopyxis sp. TaxID=1908224 RepID=UPI002ABA799B|nr:cytochrome ubiquinol oxidase subunit I [Sphingopyxis sp.]MDZ3830720.1 cytochrome ubiquinol oxidase subunit I [Sphingopyxis sp.]
MDGLDPLMLARIQFAANISFHILFPTITIALGWALLGFKIAYNRSGDEAWMDAYRLWVKIFALSFAMGVVSGITMSFQFGTNWPGYMERVGNVAGPLLAYEVLTAFFLEAVFLGIMLFGFRRVPGWLHTLATLLVAAGTTLSAFWIIALNSWMQTPAGYEIRGDVVHAADWWAIIFNPSMPYRLAHMLLASALTVSFLIAGMSAWRWLRDGGGEGVRRTLKAAIYAAALLIPVQIFVGDQHGLNTLEHQPQKVAAMEANWETRPHVPLVLFAIPDSAARTNHVEIAIPSGASLILKHRADGVVPGLNDYRDNHPPVGPLFWGFRIMVGLGVLMLALSWLSAWTIRRRGVEGLPRWLARTLVAMTFSGWLATLAGWYVTEIGRQPWLVSGVLRTADAVGPVGPGMVAGSLALYLTVYAVLLTAYIAVLYRLARLGKAAPQGKPMFPIPGAADATAAAQEKPA